MYLQTCFEEGWCHSYQSFNTCYEDTGLWGMYSVVPGNHINVSAYLVFIEKGVIKIKIITLLIPCTH